MKSVPPRGSGWVVDGKLVTSDNKCEWTPPATAGGTDLMGQPTWMLAQDHPRTTGGADLIER